MARFTSYRRLSHESTTQDWERQSHCSFPHPAGQWRKPLEACTFVNTAGGGEFTLGPEHDFLIAGFAGEVDTFLNQPLADSQAPGGRLDEQETEFGNRRGLLNKKHRPDVFRVSLGDPAT